MLGQMLVRRSKQEPTPGRHLPMAPRHPHRHEGKPIVKPRVHAKMVGSKIWRLCLASASSQDGWAPKTISKCMGGRPCCQTPAEHTHENAQMLSMDCVGQPGLSTTRHAAERLRGTADFADRRVPCRRSKVTQARDKSKQRGTWHVKSA